MHYKIDQLEIANITAFFFSFIIQFIFQFLRKKEVDLGIMVEINIIIFIRLFLNFDTV